MMKEDWDKAVADSKKLLGPKGTIPHGKMAVAIKSGLDFNTALGHFLTARDALTKKVEDLENMLSKVENNLKSAKNEVIDSDYNLDTKIPDDKKKVDAATKVLQAFFDKWSKTADDYGSKLDNLDDYLDHFEKFKPAKL